MTIAGVLPVFQTPFGPDDQIDRTALARQFDWLFANGADGVVLAMVSEVLRLSSEERDALAGLTCELAAGRGVSVVSVGAESTRVAIRHARHAEKVGATAVMATPPALHQADEEQLFGYFMSIADAVSVPLIVQDASGYVGANLPITLQARLHAELGDRVLFKPEAHPVGPRLTMLREQTGGQAMIFEGTGGLYLVDSFRRGAVGTMPAADLVWALSAMWRALCAGDYPRAYRIAGPLALMVSLQTSLDGFVAIEKHLLVKQGVLASAAMRGPVGHFVDAQTAAEVEVLLDLLRAAVADE
ncbi:4-hydroxy-tetrahydrodipicolinate synthase [Nonomuraea thailandensis]|uniref:4-hydroxy-tetrahydrodipicolinate synthase n=1 Tax=Nonomuraea thailandensis TaxID=1188745 RepID=A0A9X2GFD4_9ACTN|nr:dihydrodipicolinate synthase family protein [Nonomuraea thailandensis]MCP2353598.1 4-hydroxy-tetrahydrodipicolinate synthase [Nonomuraea thailandensis]